MKSYIKNINFYLDNLYLMNKFKCLLNTGSFNGISIEYISFIYNDIVINFNIPYYYTDHIQRAILNTNTFYEVSKLEYFNSLIDSQFKSLRCRYGIIDAGSNIGNHTIYFSKIIGFKNIYCFEPLDSIRCILANNIAINEIDAQIFPFILSNKIANYQINKFNPSNFGATSFIENNSSHKSTYSSNFIDNIPFEGKISAIKIDTEGYELSVLEGATEILREFHPVLWIESFQYFKEINSFLQQYNYILAHQIMDDYFFV